MPLISVSRKMEIKESVQDIVKKLIISSIRCPLRHMTSSIIALATKIHQNREYGTCTSCSRYSSAVVMIVVSCEMKI